MSAVLRILSRLVLGLMKGLLGLVLVLAVLYLATSFYVDWRLDGKDYRAAYSDCRKVWTTRGLYGGGVPQNSIESVAAAFDAGAQGAEVDVFFDRELGDYIVSHDYPYRLKYGKVMRLEELFDALGPRYPGHYYWLDFKNIRFLGDQEEDAVKRLAEISTRNGIRDFIYVEGEAPLALVAFRDGGFHSLFDTHPLPESMGVLSAIAIGIYKIVYYFGNFTVMGMEYGERDDPVYGPATRQRLGKIPLFLYHVPVDDELIDQLLPLSSVRTLIIGADQSVNFHDRDACGPATAR